MKILYRQYRGGDNFVDIVMVDIVMYDKTEKRIYFDTPEKARNYFGNECNEL